MLQCVEGLVEETFCLLLAELKQMPVSNALLYLHKENLLLVSEWKHLQKEEKIPEIYINHHSLVKILSEHV